MPGIFGTIDPPPGTDTYKGLGEGGLNNFVSNLLALLAVVGGVFVFVNFIIAGYQYLSSNGNPQTIASAGNKILQSLIGLVIIVAPFVIASLIGLVFFKDPTFLLSPTFFTVKP